MKTLFVLHRYVVVINMLLYFKIFEDIIGLIISRLNILITLGHLGKFVVGLSLAARRY
jgi:hypothetical protein